MTQSDDTCTSSSGETFLSGGELLPGTAVGEYVVSAFLARGGCGSVYRAEHATDGRAAAVKVLHGSLAALPKMVERFAREVRVLSLLCDPNIIEVYDVGSLRDGRPYYVMEHLEGRTLGALLDRQGRLSPIEAFEILAPVCATLEAAHAAGVIHRDVKASNIMLIEIDGAGPVVKLLDFGIAKLVEPLSSHPGGLTSEGRQVGTLTIMAPEQLLGGPIDHRVDVYALGVLLFRMITGDPPFDAQTPTALARQHIEEPAPRPSQRAPLSPALDAVVLRCLEKQPDRRYGSVSELLSALRAAVTAGSAARRGDGTPDLPARGVAVYVELRTPPGHGPLDDALEEDIGVVLDQAEEALLDAGFLLPFAPGTAVLGVRLLSVDPRRAAGERAGALDTAAALLQRIAERPRADARIQVSVSVHAAAVVTRFTSGQEVVDGELLRTDRWAPRDAVASVRATREAVEGLAGYAVADSPGGYFRVAPPR